MRKGQNESYEQHQINSTSPKPCERVSSTLQNTHAQTTAQAHPPGPHPQMGSDVRTNQPRRLFKSPPYALTRHCLGYNLYSSLANLSHRCRLGSRSQLNNQQQTCNIKNPSPTQSTTTVRSKSINSAYRSRTTHSYQQLS